MPTFKLTYIFNAAKAGWSETWYTIAADRTTARTRAIALQAKRAPILGVGASLEAIRISDVAILNDAELIHREFDKGSERTFNRDTVQTAVLVTVGATGGYSRDFMIRGLKDTDVNLDGETLRMVADPSLVRNVQAFVASLITQRISLQVNDHSAANPQHPITQVLVLGGGRWEITVPDLAMVAGDRCIVYNMQPEFVNLKGVQRVKETLLAGIYELQSIAPTGLIPIYNGEMLAREVVTIYPLVNRGSISRIANRKTGRAFFVPRGRRSATP